LDFGWRQSNLHKTINRNLLILVLLLLFLGLVFVADASAPQALSMFDDKFYFLKQQLIWAAIGIAAFFAVSKIKYSFWEKVSTPFFIVTIILLIIVLIPGVGFTTLGARRWIPLGFFSIQPSELVKLSLCILLAKAASKKKSAMTFFVPVVLVIGLIMLQPDLGTALVVSGIAFSQIFVSGISMLHILGSLIVGVLATLVLILISPYRKERLLTFLEATRDPLGKSYHIRQILIALGSGGITGVGLGASRQKFLFLPESSTDSIFAVIAEELGLIGAVIIIFLFGYFLYLGFKIARNAPDVFSSTLATGITVWIGGQAFLNIASMVALVPLTGIPLPFMSYGGSSLVMILSACGILLNISKYAVKKR
jgi:cell division protein FtsW